MTSQVGLLASVIKQTPAVELTFTDRVAMTNRDLITYFRDSSLGQSIKALFTRHNVMFTGEGYVPMNPYDGYTGSSLGDKQVRKV